MLPKDWGSKKKSIVVDEEGEKLTLRYKKKLAMTTQNLSVLYGILKYAEPEARRMVICNPRTTIRLLLEAKKNDDEVVRHLAEVRLRQLT